jgi:hypothetical protein
MNSYTLNQQFHMLIVFNHNVCVSPNRSFIYLMNLTSIILSQTNKIDESGQHVVYRSQDMVPQSGTCGNNHNHDTTNHVEHETSKGDERKNNGVNVGNHNRRLLYGNQHKYVQVLVVNDLIRYVLLAPISTSMYHCNCGCE